MSKLDDKERSKTIYEYNAQQIDCDQSCIATIKQTAAIVTVIDESLHYHTEDRTILSLFRVLHRRAVRLISDKTTRRRLSPFLNKFICNLVMYFRNLDELDDFTLTNIVTALSLADSHSQASHGYMDYSTLIRRPNPAHPDSDNYFVIGREGWIDDPACPMKKLEANPESISEVPREQLSVFYGFYHARQMNPSRGAPKIHVEEFQNLIPAEIRMDSVLEDAFTEVCLSDGAWELYQRKIAA